MAYLRESQCIFMQPSDCEVFYAFEEVDGEYVKVGVSTNVVQRLRFSQTHSARELRIACQCCGGRILEHRIKEAFPPVRGEWLRKTPDLLALLASMDSPACATLAFVRVGKKGLLIKDQFDRLGNGAVVDYFERHA